MTVGSIWPEMLQIINLALMQNAAKGFTAWHRGESGIGIQDLRAVDFWVIPGWIDSKRQDYVSVCAFIPRKPTWEKGVQVSGAGKDPLPSASSQSSSFHLALLSPPPYSGRDGVALLTRGKREGRCWEEEPSLGPT